MRKRKRFIILITAIIIFLVATISCLAHSGRTDSKGGHYDRSSGEYHYHHGYSAHQHPNGVCPYETEDSYYVQDDDYISDNEKDKSSSGFLDVFFVLLTILSAAILVFVLIMSGCFLLNYSYKSIELMRTTLSLDRLGYIYKPTCVILCLILAVFVISPILISLPMIFREQIAEVLASIFDKDYNGMLIATIMLSCAPFLTFAIGVPSYVAHILKLKTEPIDLTENEILSYLHFIWFILHKPQNAKAKTPNDKIVSQIIENHFVKFKSN